MRTTITLDDDLARALKEAAHRSDRSFKQVVNQAIRAGLQGAMKAPRAKRYRLAPSSMGGVLPGVNLDKALALADALEDEELARKLERRK